MADIFTKKKRSEIMSKIRAKNTRFENSFCKLLSKDIYNKGFRYRRNYKKIKGSPDIVFVGRKIAVFLDGDFWHGYKYKDKREKLPEVYWRGKIAANIRRDRRTNLALKKDGWRVVRIWEHQIRKHPDRQIKKIKKLLYRE